jgi:hypothetical protein
LQKFFGLRKFSVFTGKSLAEKISLHSGNSY